MTVAVMPVSSSTPPLAVPGLFFLRLVGQAVVIHSLCMPETFLSVIIQSIVQGEYIWFVSEGLISTLLQHSFSLTAENNVLVRVFCNFVPHPCT